MKNLIAILVFSFLCGYPCGKNESRKIYAVVEQKSDMIDARIEITFADVSLTYEDRMRCHFLQDSLFRAGNDGVYHGETHRGFHPDTPFVMNGEKDALVVILKDSSIRYTNSAFSVRGYAFDTLDRHISPGYSLWTFTHRSVRDK